MRYATWNLVLDENINELTGPEASILSQEFLVRPISNIGNLNDHYILGIFENNFNDLSFWNFTEIDKDTAIQIYSENFIETPADPESLRPKFTLEMALQYHFSDL